jgi:CRISPR system Cascade subunit CasE
MHLTRLRIDARSAQARRDLSDPYDMHRTLVRAFVSDETQKPPRFLWRVDTQAAWSDPVLLVQSSHAADWSVLAALPNYLKEQQGVESKFVAPEQLLQAGARYRFRLLANPTVTRDGKRYGLTSEEAQLAWLTRQGGRCGFSVEAGLVTSSDVLHSRKGDLRISLQRACFEGVLQAVDIQALEGALLAGIGPGKAFGCGLLSIARCGGG